MAGDGVRQPGGGRGHRCRTTAATTLADEVVEVGHGGVALGVEDAVHVLRAADDSQLRHGLVGGDDQLHARTAGADQPLAGGRVNGATGAEERLVLDLGDVAD